MHTGSTQHLLYKRELSRHFGREHSLSPSACQAFKFSADSTLLGVKGEREAK